MGGLCPTREAIMNVTMCGGCVSFKDCIETYKLLPESTEENCMYADMPTYMCNINSSRLFRDVVLPIEVVVAFVATVIFSITLIHGVIVKKKILMKKWMILLRCLGWLILWLIPTPFIGVGIVSLVMISNSSDWLMNAVLFFRIFIVLCVGVPICIMCVLGIVSLAM